MTFVSISPCTRSASSSKGHKVRVSDLISGLLAFLRWCRPCTWRFWYKSHFLMVRLAVGLETGPDSRLEVCFIKCVALGTVLQRALLYHALSRKLFIRFGWNFVCAITCPKLNCTQNLNQIGCMVSETIKLIELYQIDRSLSFSEHVCFILLVLLLVLLLELFLPDFWMSSVLSG